MTTDEVLARLIELHPSSDPHALADVAPLVVEFGYEGLTEFPEAIATLYEWRAVLATLGPDGMTLKGMLNYEWHQMPGVRLCQRIETFEVRTGSDDVPYLDPPAWMKEDGAQPVTGFRPIPARRAKEGVVWLRQQGGYAVVDGVPLRMD